MNVTAKKIALVKWGGSLITDKSRRQVSRPDVIERLAAEITEFAASHPGRVVLGHGSGSFGHVSAKECGIAGGLVEGEGRRSQLVGLSETQRQAAELHRLVLEAVRKAGALPFSIRPGSAMVAELGRPMSVALEPVALALDLGLLPVVFGDVVLDRGRGASIFSTENVFVAIAQHLPPYGYRVGEAFWLGETDGIYGADQERIPQVTPENMSQLTAAVGESAGIDVTGGMRHRLKTTLDLLELGVDSWILDGRKPGVLDQAALAGASRELGTRIMS